jgi:hypothetical protein
MKIHPPLSQAERKAIRVRKPILVKSSVKRQWTRDLPLKWFKRYGGELFTVRDLYRAAVTQRQYHFPEWYLAVHLRKTKGLHSILKSNHVNDPDKERRVAKLLGVTRGALKFLRARRHKAAPPDLLVFNPRTGVRYFAEAKFGRDKLRVNQRRYFARLYKRTGIHTRLFHLVLR